MMRATMRTVLVLAVALVGSGASAQSSRGPAPTGRTWVYLRDKGYESAEAQAAAARDLERTYDARAIERRRARRTSPGLFDERDLPVAEAYRHAIAGTGARIHVESRWMNAVSVEATPAQLGEIRSLPCVGGVEPVRGAARPESAPAKFGAGAHTTRDFYGYSSDQLNQISVATLHAQGFNAAGVIIGILDTGFVTTHQVFHQPGHELNIIAAHDFVKGDDDVGVEAGDNPDQHVHGTLILGCIGSYLPDTLVGGAYGASFVLAKTEDLDSETPVEEDTYVAGLEFIEAHGGDMTTSSLGYWDWYSPDDMDGVTAVTTIAVNIATANGVFCVTAAGNRGHDSDPGSPRIIAPADAFQVISCGAVDSGGGTADFSSAGPSADGRVKPEVLARGVQTATIWPYDDVSYATADGTSLSTPLVACAVACLLQARPAWTVDQMRYFLFTTASEFEDFGYTTDPVYARGYGVLNAAAAAAADCNGNGIPDSDDLAAGDSCDFDHDGTPDECQGLACRPDFNHDCRLNINDYIAFQAAWQHREPAADFNGDGKYNIRDFIAFQGEFVVGCG